MYGLSVFKVHLQQHLFTLGCGLTDPGTTYTLILWAPSLVGTFYWLWMLTPNGQRWEQLQLHRPSRNCDRFLQRMVYPDKLCPTMVLNFAQRNFGGLPKKMVSNIYCVHRTTPPQTELWNARYRPSRRLWRLAIPRAYQWTTDFLTFYFPIAPPHIWPLIRRRLNYFGTYFAYMFGSYLAWHEKSGKEQTKPTKG